MQDRMRINQERFFSIYNELKQQASPSVMYHNPEELDRGEFLFSFLP